MAPPLRHGRALAVQRLSGLLLLLALAGLVSLSVALYAKAFTPTVDVVLLADRAGNQLTRGADVKVRGVLVGEVRAISSTASGARLLLALDPDAAAALPADTRARLLPKTLFGERFVALEPERGSTAGPLTDGAVLAQDRSETGRETAQALDSLLPLLQELRPDRVSTTLHALSSTLRGRGERVGENAQLVHEYLRALNPELPVLEQDLRGTADLADTVDASLDDLVRLARASSAVGRSLVDTRSDLDAFLRGTAGTASTARGFVAENERRLVDLAREGVPALRVYERYAPGLPCLFAGIAGIDAEGERVFGGDQPGLHITLEVVSDLGGFEPGQEPLYADDAGPTCYGLEGEPVRPFPTYRNPDDGYRDGEEVDPWTGMPPGEGRSPLPVSGTARRSDAVGRAVAPALGLTAPEVPDVAVLLYGPLAAGR